MQEKIKLRKIPGEKIRWQYFNVPIYKLALLAWMSTGLLIVMAFDWSMNIIVTDVLIILKVYGIFIAPFIILSVINRFWIGKIVCVLNDDGIYYKDGLIEWNYITHIEYNIDDGIRYGHYSSAYIIGRNMKIEIVHAPFMLLRKAKKYKSEIITTFSKGNKGEFVFYGVLPIILVVIFKLFELLG